MKRALRLSLVMLVATALTAVVGVFYFAANGHHYCPIQYEHSPFAGKLHRSLENLSRGSNAEVLVWLSKPPKGLDLEKMGIDIVSAEITRTPPFLVEASGYSWLMRIEANVDVQLSSITLTIDGQMTTVTTSPRYPLIGNTGLESPWPVYANRWWLLNWSSSRRESRGVWVPRSTVEVLPDPVWPITLANGYDGFLFHKRLDGSWAASAGKFHETKTKEKMSEFD